MPNTWDQIVVGVITAIIAQVLRQIRRTAMLPLRRLVGEIGAAGLAGGMAVAIAMRQGGMTDTLAFVVGGVAGWIGASLITRLADFVDGKLNIRIEQTKKDVENGTD